MRNTSRKFAALLHQRFGLMLAAAIVAVMSVSTLLVVRVHPLRTDNCLLALKCNVRRSRPISRNLLNLRKVGDNVNRIVSGAMEFASSL
jgi:hypothetical protein